MKNIYLLIMMGGLFSSDIGYSDEGVEELCSGIYLESSRSVSFSDTEKRLICGDPDSPAYSNLPVYQVKKTLQAILQTKGFHQVVFREESGGLWIEAGNRSFIRSIKLQTDQSVAIEETLIKKIDSPLTPEALDEIQAWYLDVFLSDGNPCPEVKVSADPVTGVVVVNVQNLGEQPLLEIREDLTTGMVEGVMSRYYAFGPKRSFNGRLLEITSDRIVADRIADDSRFSVLCEETGFRILQRATVGPPRLLTVGVGANTEEGPLGKVSWSASGLGAQGSSFSASLLGSYREQSLNLFAKWWAFTPSSRFHWRPEVEIKRAVEKKFETVDALAQVFLGARFDTKGFGGTVYLGPSLKYSHIVKGLGPQTSLYLSWDTTTTLTSHVYEYYRQSPRSGWRFKLETSFIQNEFGSDVSGYLFRFEPRVLINLGQTDPPVLIVSTRGLLATTFTPSDNRNQTPLPVPYRHYLGGADNLRGFGRNEIPFQAEGALSVAYLGLELRSNSILFEKLQPLVFLDMGLVSETPFPLDLPIYWSPGAGLRWESPVGVFRGTLAHGYLTGASEVDRDRFSHLQGYLSYGQEF